MEKLCSNLKNQIYHTNEPQQQKETKNSDLELGYTYANRRVPGMVVVVSV